MTRSAALVFISSPSWKISSTRRDDHGKSESGMGCHRPSASCLPVDFIKLMRSNISLASCIPDVRLARVIGASCNLINSFSLIIFAFSSISLAAWTSRPSWSVSTRFIISDSFFSSLKSNSGAVTLGLPPPLVLSLLGLSGTSEVITLLPGDPFWSPTNRFARASGSMINKG